MTQIKKKFLSLLFAFVLLFSTKAFAIEGDQSDVVDQKSVIEEQQEESLIAGINDYYDLEQSEIIRTKDEEVIQSPYVGIIENLTDEEKELICRITWLESANQPIEGQRAVIEVILNRLQLEQWPNSIEEVLSKPGQFTTWRNRNKVTEEQINQIYKILELVYKEKIILSDTKYVYFNNSPHNSKDTINIKGHWFWK